MSQNINCLHLCYPIQNQEIFPPMQGDYYNPQQINLILRNLKLSQQSAQFEEQNESDKEIDKELVEENQYDKKNHKTNKHIIKEFVFQKNYSVLELYTALSKVSYVMEMETTFKEMEKYFSQNYNLSLYSIRYAIHQKDEKKDNKEFAKLTQKNFFRRIQQSINLIMQLYHDKHTFRKLSTLERLFNKGEMQNQIDMLTYNAPVEKKGTYKECLQRNWRALQYLPKVYIYFKVLLFNQHQKLKFDSIQLAYTKILVSEPKRTEIIDHIDEARQLLPITNVSLGTLYNKNFYSYLNLFQVYSAANKIKPEILPSMEVYFQQYNKRVKSLVIVCKMFNQFSLKMKISMQKLTKIQQYSQGNNSIYFFSLVECPQYYINLYKSNCYTPTKFQSLGDRVQNFPLLSNRTISKNEVLKMFLYNNSVVRIDLSKTSSSQTTFFSFVKRIKQTYQKYVNVSIQQGLPYKSQRETDLQNLFSYNQLNRILNKFQITDKPILSEHIRWKARFHLLILVRHNLIHSTYNLLLEFIQQNILDLELISKIILNEIIKIKGDREFRDDRKVLHDIKENFQFQTNSIFAKEETADIMIVKDNQFGKIYKVLLTPSGIIYNAPTPQQKCRLLKQYEHETQFFCKATLKDDSRQPLKNKRYLILYFLRNQIDNIDILGKVFEPLASSNSQLRTSSLWIVNPIPKNEGKFRALNRETVIKFLGNFDDIEVPAKKYARIGQSFSTSWSQNGQDIEIKQIDDIESHGYLFTDGIGQISNDLLQKYVKSLKTSQQQKKHICCLQIRYLGSKGVLTKFEYLESKQIALRPSMIKYECPDARIKKYFDILDFNKYRSGFLNRQIIILLRSLYIKDYVFEEMQQDYIAYLNTLNYKQTVAQKLYHSEIDDMPNNPENSFQILCQLNKVGFSLDQQPFFQGVMKFIRLEKFRDLNQKCHILIPQAARLIGIIDEYALLDEGQLFCSTFKENQEKDKQYYNVVGDVIITKNPALDPADVRRMKCVSIQTIAQRCKKFGYPKNFYQSFINCVVFPCAGKYPITAQISGSDLDGDLFFICWDKRLLITKHQKQNFIDQPKTAKKQGLKLAKKVVTYDEMMDFFVEYVNSEKLGTIDNSHLVHADKNRVNCANSKICKKLAFYHGKAVDYGKTGDMPTVPKKLLADWFPSYMRQNGKVYQSKSVLGRLYRQSLNYLDIDPRKKQQFQLKQQFEYFDKQILSMGKFDIDEEECERIILLLAEYQAQMEILINSLCVQSEYQIFLGQRNQKEMKRKATEPQFPPIKIVEVRKRFFKAFFSPFSQEQHKYKRINFTDPQKSVDFSQQVVQSAINFYFVSYFVKFSKIYQDKIKVPTGIQKRVKQLAEDSAYFGQFSGFVWFTIPKLMIYIKRIAAQRTYPQKKGK